MEKKVVKKIELKEEELSKVVGGSTAFVTDWNVWARLKRIFGHR